MESDIGYRRVQNEKENGRYLDVFPHFPDITSLAEVEVASYTINRFLGLHVPFYIRTIFFPYIEIQHLDTTLHNGVTFAHIMTSYSFFERQRIIKLNNKRAQGIIELKKNIIITPDRKQIIEAPIKHHNNFATRALSYDLTNLFGKRITIGDWITNGNFKLFINNFRAQTVGFTMLSQDVFKDNESKIIVPIHYEAAMVSTFKNDLTKGTRKLNIITRKIAPLVNSKVIHYDLTNVTGNRKSYLEANYSSYKFKVETGRRIMYNSIVTQDATFLDGDKKDLGVDAYTRRYFLGIKRSKIQHIATSRSYNLQKNREKSLLSCDINTSRSCISIVEYDFTKGVNKIVRN